MQARYPVMLDVSDRKIVIVGGGQVALRKVHGLLAAGAKDICCVAPEIRSEMPEAVRRIEAKFESGHLDGAGLVFAATDLAEVNNYVVECARERGIWVNRADFHEQQIGDFTIPAVLRQGLITVAVSASGSPTLATKVRDELTQHVAQRWSEMAAVMQELRPRILASPQLSEERARLLLMELAGEEAMAVLSGRGKAGLQSWLAQRYPELAQV